MISIKPTRRKVLISLIPFIPVILMSVFLVEIPVESFSPSHLNLLIFSVLLRLQVAIGLVAYGSILLMAFPLQSILVPLGMWYYSDFFIGAYGPNVSTSGMFLTASIYSIIFYLWISFKNGRKK